MCEKIIKLESRMTILRNKAEYNLLNKNTEKHMRHYYSGQLDIINDVLKILKGERKYLRNVKDTEQMKEARSK